MPQLIGLAGREAGRHHHYTVTARAAADHLVTANVQVDILHIGVDQSAVWLSAANSNPYTIAFLYHTYPTDNIYVWSDPPGSIS